MRKSAVLASLLALVLVPLASATHGGPHLLVSNVTEDSASVQLSELACGTSYEVRVQSAGGLAGSASFTTDPCSSSRDPLRVSLEADRDPSDDLEGYSFGGNAYVFLSNTPAKQGPVSFYLDSVFRRTEYAAPWDFNGSTGATGAPIAFNFGALSAGTHTIRAIWVNGEDSSTFTVGSAPPHPPSEECPAPIRMGYTALFCDGFAGASLNRTVWDPYGTDQSGGSCWPGHNGAGLRCERAIRVDGNGNLNVIATPSTQTASGKLESGGVATVSAYNNLFFGRYETRVRIDPDDSDHMSGVVISHPADGTPYCDGEADFWETGIGAGNETIKSFLHYELGVIDCSTTEQVYCNSGMSANAWHDVVLEVHPNLWRVTIDGTVTCNVTDSARIFQGRKFWVFQVDAFNCPVDRVNGSVCPGLAAPVKLEAAYARLYTRN
jgi:hypothetical protein